jgi:hypothetical protein
MASMAEILMGRQQSPGANSGSPEEMAALQAYIRKYGLSDALQSGSNDPREWAAATGTALPPGPELSNYVRPGSDSFEQRAAQGAAEGMVTLSGLPYVVGTGQDIAQAASDPSSENLINAGADLAFLPLALAGPGKAMRPAMSQILNKGTALGGAGLIGAGIVAGSGEAQALTKRQKNQLDQEARRAEIKAREKAEEIKAGAEADRIRRDAEAAAKIREADAEAERQRKAAEDVSRQAEWDRKVKMAQDAQEKALARDTHFSDTPVGQATRKMGGLTPAIGGALAAAIARAAPTARGGLGRVLQNPLVAGGAGGFTASNYPFVFGMQAEPINPKRQAIEDAWFLLPEGHPDKKRYEALLRDKELLPVVNPAQKAASDEFSNNFLLRSAAGTVEGMAGGLPGHDVVAAAKGGSTYLGRILRGARDFFGRGGQQARQRYVQTQHGWRNPANGQWVKRRP